MHGAPARITRRDFLNGVALAGGSLAAEAGALAGHAAAPADAHDDPARRLGLQGHRDADAAAAHAWRDAPLQAQRQAAERDDGIEDLVVVGAGLSGLAGAWLYQRHAGRPVRVLMLDALDDIGGHARRNEFVSRSGRRLVGYGGSQSLDSPSLFSPAVHSVLDGLGLDLKRFETEWFDRGWAARHGVAGQALHFDAGRWGDNRLVVPGRSEPAAGWIARTPLPPDARADWLRLLEPAQATGAASAASGSGRALAAMAALTARPPPARLRRLASISYAEFLRRCHAVSAPVIEVLMARTQAYFGVGIDATCALDAWAAGLPGFGALGLDEALAAAPREAALLAPSARLLRVSDDAYIYHFPDGNAGLARALLHALRPDAFPGVAADAPIEALAGARLDRSRLADPGAALRVRLGATVVGLRHLGPPTQAERVEVRWLDAQGQPHLVHARQVLLACWHRVIARLTDEIPLAQRRALDDQVKVPLVYANVLLGNWRAWQRAGVNRIESVGGFWQEAALDFPVSMGSVRCAASPDEPILVHLSKVVVPGDGRAPRDQSRSGREMLSRWRFEDFEAPLVALLQGALGPHGFDAARDIEAITVNRWSHGYALEYARPWDADWPSGPLPCVRARRGWGRVAIANSDAGAYAYAHSAIDQATRAVAELLPQARLPAWSAQPGPPPRTS